MLLIQGTGVHGDAWDPHIAGLRTHYQCVSLDNRGLGASQPQGGPLSVEQMAEDAQVLLDALGWGAAHVVGHSLGGLIALHLAATARSRVRSLALLCTFARGRDATRLSPAMLWTGFRTRVGTRRQRRTAFLELVVSRADLAAVDPDELAARLAPLFGHDLADQPPVVMTQLRAMQAYDATPRLGLLAGLPTLVVSGGQDRIALPALSRALRGGHSRRPVPPAGDGRPRRHSSGPGDR